VAVPPVIPSPLPEDTKVIATGRTPSSLPSGGLTCSGTTLSFSAARYHVIIGQQQDTLQVLYMREDPGPASRFTCLKNPRSCTFANDPNTTYTVYDAQSF
jgi:hypothetical protein